MSMMMRGARGAITVDENTAEAILEATETLLREMIAANEIEEDTVASIFFTATPDVNASFPAEAARKMGWLRAPLLCFQEMAVPDGLPSCIRVLLHWNTTRSIDEVKHTFLRGAVVLRPDLVQDQEG